MSENKNPYEGLEDSELLNKLESAEMFAQVMESEQWQAFREAWRRIYDEADKKLNVIDPTNATEVMKCQYAKRFYKNVLQTTINQMHEVADLSYAQAQERGLLNRFVERVRAKLSFVRK